LFITFLTFTLLSLGGCEKEEVYYEGKFVIETKGGNFFTLVELFDVNLGLEGHYFLYEEMEENTTKEFKFYPGNYIVLLNYVDPQGISILPNRTTKMTIQGGKYTIEIE